MSQEAGTSTKLSSQNSNGGAGSAGTASGASDRRATRITSLNPHDVLLGRGSGYNDYEGNILFRNVVAERKREYMSTAKREDKKRIAHEVFGQINSTGGRFLKRRIKKKVRGVIIDHGVYFQVEFKVALEKCKQALRQNWDTSDNDTGATTGESDEDGARDHELGNHPLVAGLAVGRADALMAPSGLVQPQLSRLDSVLPMLPILRSNMQSATADSRLLLFQSTHLALQQHQQQRSALIQQALLQRLTEATFDHQYDSTIPLQDLRPPALSDSITQLSMRQPALFAPHATVEVLLNGESGHGSTTSNTGGQGMSKKPAAESSDRSDALDALSALAVADRPKFTDAQHAEEQASLSYAERMEALADKFGRMCIVKDRQSKPRRDLDRPSIQFLVSQMKLELDRIPDDEKRSMLVANTKCVPEEFSEARLEQFLRCEGMNVKVRLQTCVY